MPRTVFDIGLPCALLGLWSVNRVNSVHEAWLICSPIPIGRDTVEGCAGETGRGDTLLKGTSVAVVGRASGCWDVDEARCLHGNNQLHIRLNHDCFFANCLSYWGVDMSMTVGDRSTARAACHARTSCLSMSESEAVPAPDHDESSDEVFCSWTTIYQRSL